MILRPPRSTRTDVRLPYTPRFRSLKHERTDEGLHGAGDGSARLVERRLALELARFAPLDDDQRQDFLDPRRVGFRRRPFLDAGIDCYVDRKSTRLNSSH